MHHSDAVEAEHICDLMGVGEHRRGAMRDHCTGELRRGQHTGFDMHVRVAQPGDHETALYINHVGFRPDTVIGIRHHAGDPAPGDRNVVFRQNLSGMHIDPTTSLKDHVRRLPPGGGCDQVSRDVGP